MRPLPGAPPSWRHVPAGRRRSQGGSRCRLGHVQSTQWVLRQSGELLAEKGAADGDFMVPPQLESEELFGRRFRSGYVAPEGWSIGSSSRWSIMAPPARLTRLPEEVLLTVFGVLHSCTEIPVCIQPPPGSPLGCSLCSWPPSTTCTGRRRPCWCADRPCEPPA